MESYEEEGKIISFIEDTFKAVFPGAICLGQVELRAALIEINPQWHEEFIVTLSGTNISNQRLPISDEKPSHVWHNLRVRSATEVKIAEALERAQVLFLPNCMARLGFSQRQNREVDFLVCDKGKWKSLKWIAHSFIPLLALLQTMSALV